MPRGRPIAALVVLASLRAVDVGAGDDVATSTGVGDKTREQVARAIAANQRACERGEAGCDPVALLSRLERRAADRVVAEKGLAFDRAPHGKKIGRVLVTT